MALELYAMLYQRLTNSAELGALLAKYKRRPAIFYGRAASADDPGWDEEQYPRIDYTVDMQENPARNTSGILAVNVWCDTQTGAEPEDIEIKLRELLHASFAQADDYPYCFAWVRSDAFEIKNDADQTVRTIGVTVIFDIMAFPCQYTMYPDPIKAMNQWTKATIPTAIVIGEDTIDGWTSPTRETPIIYWRLASQGVERKQFACTWLNVTLEGYVCAKNAADRLYNLTRLNMAQALAGHIPMEDTSPLFLRSFAVKPHLNYLSEGQIQASGHFGILQPDKHFHNNWTGYKLCNTNIPREKITSDDAIVIDGDASAPHKFRYPASSEETEAGILPMVPGSVKSYDFANRKKITK